MTAFDEAYFRTNTYANVSFGRFTQYWWATRYYAALIRRVAPRGGRLLEIGCGLGHLLGRLEGDYETVGVDVNEWAIAQARGNAPRSRLEVRPAEAIAEFAEAEFDVVVSKHVVEHLPDPALVLRQVGRILQPGGWLLFSTPNLDGLLRPLKGEQWIGFLDPTHISLKRPHEWVSLTEAAGLAVRKVWSDGFWNTPYLPLLPGWFQRVLFGGPGGLQAMLGLAVMPVRLGESVIILARKTDERAG